jgi:Uma2 family endonuclease
LGIGTLKNTQKFLEKDSLLLFFHTRNKLLSKFGLEKKRCFLNALGCFRVMLKSKNKKSRMITSLSQLDADKLYTYADYLQWQLKERVELIKGKLFKMSPAPNEHHQWVSMKLSNLMFEVVAKKCDCRIYAAPFDVKLSKSSSKNEEIFTVVQPDITVVCDKTKLDGQGCLGAPDLVVEILSPGNNKKEMQTKFALYEENKIPEYWLVFPLEEALQQFVLNKEGKYQFMRFYNTDDIVQSAVFPALKVPLSEAF